MEQQNVSISSQSIKLLFRLIIQGFPWFFFGVGSIMACDDGCSNVAGTLINLGFYSYPIFIVASIIIWAGLFFKKENEKLLSFMVFVKKYSLYFVFLPIVTSILSFIF